MDQTLKLGPYFRKKIREILATGEVFSYRIFIFTAPKLPKPMPIKDLLQPEKTFRITGMLRIESENDRFLGPGRLELLENIIKTGSISQAAKQMGMSYKKAWDLVNSMNQHTIKPIVSTQTGGEKGGGTIVTEEGKQLIAAFRKLHEEFQASFDEKIKNFLQSQI